MKKISHQPRGKRSCFCSRVLTIVRHIPKGSVLSYGAVAAAAGNPQGARAVGAILKTNFDPSIPCHRVIRSDGALGGYNRGMRRKKLLLEEEGALKTEH